MENTIMGLLGSMVLGLRFDAFLMLASGVFYILCAYLLWKPMRREKNELISALFAFLCYQAGSMFFMGLEFQTMNMNYGYIAALFILIGSAYMLKFPFSSFSRPVRKAIFGLSIVAVLAIFVWFMQTSERQVALMHFTLWYDLAINGILVGGFMILLAFRTTSGPLRIKAFGGGSGVMSCCVLANSAMLGGAMVTGATFGFLAPVLILGSLFWPRGANK